MIAKTWYQVELAIVRPVPIPALPVPAAQAPPVVLVKAVPVIIVALVESAAYPAAISSIVFGVPASFDSVKPLIHPLTTLIPLEGAANVPSPRRNVVVLFGGVGTAPPTVDDMAGKSMLAAALSAVPFPFNNPVMVVLRVMTGAVLGVATVPAKPFAVATDTDVTVPTGVS